MKRSELRRSDPEQIRAWQSRSKPMRKGKPRRIGRTVAREVEERSGGRCEAVWEDGLRCTRRASHRHHRWRASQGGPDEAWNLLHTCAGPDGCHDRIHANPALALRLGLLLHSPPSGVASQ